MSLSPCIYLRPSATFIRMKRSRWAFFLLAATAVLFGQRADASRTPLTDVRAAITQPQQLTAPAADAATPTDAWLVESITPLGHTDDGQPLVLISLLIPTAHLAEHTPASTRAGPYAAPKTHTRVFYIGQPPLGLWWWDADLIEWGVGGMLGFHGADIGRAARRAGAEGAQGGLEIWANTVTFGATDYAGYTESTKYSGSEYDGARIAAKVSRTGFLGAAGGAAVQGTMAGLGTLASQGGTIGNVATVARGGLNAYFAVKSAQSTGENLGTATGEFESGNYGSAALYGTLGVIDAASSGMSASGAYRDLSKGLPGLADDLNRVLAASGHDPKGGWIETGNAPRTKATSTEPTLPGNPVAQSGEVNITHKYRSGDHGPAHLHVEGGGISTRIGGAGKPINATDAPMTIAQQKVYDANKSAIRRATKKTGKWLEYQELPDN